MVAVVAVALIRNRLIIAKRNNLFLGAFRCHCRPACQYLLPTSYTIFVDSVLASSR